MRSLFTYSLKLFALTVVALSGCSNGKLDNPCATVFCTAGRICVQGVCVSQSTQKDLGTSVDVSSQKDLPIHNQDFGTDLRTDTRLDIDEDVPINPSCNSTNCSGCCATNSSGAKNCVLSTSNTQCGKQGEDCANCTLVADSKCVSGKCVTDCSPVCGGKRCGDSDNCGGNCQEGSGCCGSSNCIGCCTSNGLCTSQVSTTACGKNGSECTDCNLNGQGSTCSNGACTACVPKCDDKRCGESNGCGGTCQEGSGCCGTTTCPNGCCTDKGVCTTTLSSTVCGKNGGQCIDCTIAIPGATASFCNDGTCACTSQCANKRCGDSNGCGGTCQEGSGCCGKATCPNGCCGTDGICWGGANQQNCGNNGEACQNCYNVGTGIWCQNQACKACDPPCSSKMRCGDLDGCGFQCHGNGCCGGSNCPWGCCTIDGVCVPGTADSACGNYGSWCQDCPSVIPGPRVCSQQQCVMSNR